MQWHGPQEQGNGSGRWGQVQLTDFDASTSTDNIKSGQRTAGSISAEDAVSALFPSFKDPIK